MKISDVLREVKPFNWVNAKDRSLADCGLYHMTDPSNGDMIYMKVISEDVEEDGQAYIAKSTIDGVPGFSIRNCSRDRVLEKFLPHASSEQAVEEFSTYLESKGL